MRYLIRNFYKDEGGQSLLEYGVILSVVSIAAFAVLSRIGLKVKDKFVTLDKNLN